MIVRARIAPDHPDMGAVVAVTVFGHVLTHDYSEIDVTDEVLGKLKSNPTLETLVRKPVDAPPPPHVDDGGPKKLRG